MNQEKKTPPGKTLHQKITLSIRDREHFYKVVNWCNQNIGMGKQFWTVGGRVLRFIDPHPRYKGSYDPPAIKDWYIYEAGIDFTPVLQM